MPDHVLAKGLYLILQPLLVCAIDQSALSCRDQHVLHLIGLASNGSGERQSTMNQGTYLVGIDFRTAGSGAAWTRCLSRISREITTQLCTNGNGQSLGAQAPKVRIGGLASAYKASVRIGVVEETDIKPHRFRNGLERVLVILASGSSPHINNRGASSTILTTECTFNALG